jgi:two-component sensor histidine kinase
LGSLEKIYLVKYVFNLLLILLSTLAYGQLRSDAEREIQVRAYLDSAIASNDPIEIAEAYYRLAKIERSKLNTLESNKNLYKAIRILERKEPSYELGRCYYWLASNAGESQDLEEELKFIEKALSIHIAANSSRGKMLCYSALATRYGKNLNYVTSDRNYPPDFEKAMYYIDLSIQYAKEIKDTEALSGLLADKKRIIDLKDGKENKHFVEINPQIAIEKSERHDMILNQLDYALYLIKKGKEEEAIVWIKKCETTINKLYSTNYFLLKSLSKAYAEYYKKNKNYPQVITHLENYQTYHTKALLEDRDGAISSLHILHETEKKDDELIKQTLELKLKEQYLSSSKKLLIFSVVFLIIAIWLIVKLFRLNKKYKSISHRNALLVKEQNHRVKNNLQIVSSLLNMQVNTLTDQNSIKAMEEAQLRISSMIHLHRQLYDNESVDLIDIQHFVFDITEEILESYGLSNVKARFDIDNIFLNADKATLVGLLLNELITNACKYAFKSHSNPKLQIAIFKTGLKDLQLEISDNGLKKVDLKEQNSTSFGSKLIQMMVTQLEGTSSYKYSDGLQFVLKFKR